MPSLDLKMKSTAFKVFALSVMIVCLASSPVSRASRVLKSDSATSENPIIMKKYPGDILVKNLVGQNVVDLKTYDSMSITNEVVQKPAVYKPMVSQTLHKQRRSYYSEVEQWLKKEQEGNGSFVDSIQVVPKSPEPSNEVEDSHQLNENQNSEQSNGVQNSEPSNEVEDSHQLNENQNSEQSNEVQNSEQSNEGQNSEQSNEVQNSEQSNEGQNSEQSSDNSQSLPRIIPNSESEYFEDFSDSEDNRDNNDKKDIGLILVQI